MRKRRIEGKKKSNKDNEKKRQNSNDVNKKEEPFIPRDWRQPR